VPDRWARRQRLADADGVQTMLTSLASKTLVVADGVRGVGDVGTGDVCVGPGDGAVVLAEAAGMGAS
jgi:hypothetical protein